MVHPYDHIDPLTAATTPTPVERIDKAPVVGQWLNAHIGPLLRAGQTLDHAVCSEKLQPNHSYAHVVILSSITLLTHPFLS